MIYVLLSASNFIFLICGIYVGSQFGKHSVPLTLPSMFTHNEEATVPTELDESGEEYE